MAKTPGKGAVIADISVPLFKIAAQFTAATSEREAIAGVYVQRHPKGGIVLVGTDGHRMIVLHDVDGRCRTPMTLRNKEGLAAVKAATGNRWEVRAGKSRSRAATIPCIQLPYPDWEGVPREVEKTRGGSMAAVNPKYLASFARASCELQDSKYPSMRIVPGKSSSDPILFMFRDCPHAFGVLMPMYEMTSPAMPQFWSQMKRKTKAAAKKGRAA